MTLFIDFDIFNAGDKPQDDDNTYIWIGGDDVPDYATKLPQEIHDALDKTAKIIWYREENSDFTPCVVHTTQSVESFTPAITCIGTVTHHDTETEIKKTNKNLRNKYLQRLAEIDTASARSIRAILASCSTDEDKQKLYNLEQEAQSLRKKLEEIT